MWFTKHISHFSEIGTNFLRRFTLITALTFLLLTVYSPAQTVEDEVDLIHSDEDVSRWNFSATVLIPWEIVVYLIVAAIAEPENSEEVDILTTGTFEASLRAAYELPFFPSLATGLSFGDGLYIDDTNGRINPFLSIAPTVSLDIPFKPSEISVQIGGHVGLYQILPFSTHKPNFTWGLSLRLQYRLTPRWHIGAALIGFTEYVGLTSDVLSGIFSGYSTHPETGWQERKYGVQIDDLSIEDLYPNLLARYENNPFGTFTIQNHYQSPISNIEIGFYISDYMVAPNTWLFDEIEKGGTLAVPLTASFSKKILSLTEPVTVTARVTLSYYLDDEFRREEFFFPVRIFVKNPDI